MKTNEIFPDKLIDLLRGEYNEMKKIARSDDEPDIKDLASHLFLSVAYLLDFVELLVLKLEEKKEKK